MKKKKTNTDEEIEIEEQPGSGIAKIPSWILITFVKYDNGKLSLELDHEMMPDAGHMLKVSVTQSMSDGTFTIGDTFYAKTEGLSLLKDNKSLSLQQYTITLLRCRKAVQSRL